MVTFLGLLQQASWKKNHINQPNVGGTIENVTEKTLTLERCNELKT